jgi:hypothetical protein
MGIQMGQLRTAKNRHSRFKKRLASGHAFRHAANARLQPRFISRCRQLIGFDLYTSFLMRLGVSIMTAITIGRE